MGSEDRQCPFGCRVNAPVRLRSLREHLAIIEACRRNAAEPQSALQTHFNNALQRNMGLY
jgi:DNA-binding GntR family transcriptional regulator